MGNIVHISMLPASREKKEKKTTVTHYLTTELKTENFKTLDNFENC